MQQPIITFRKMDPSGAVEEHLREKLAWLETFYERIQSARVVIEVPHRHHHHGKVYQVRVDLTVPGGEIVVNREPGLDGAHEDVYVAIRDAFDAARRRLEEFARRRRGDAKSREALRYLPIES
jgi:ribosomal subunit interface protein